MSELVARIERELQAVPPRRSRAQMRARMGVFAFLLLAVPLLLAETALRLAGYNRPRISLAVQSATHAACAQQLNSRFDCQAFTPDRYLLWRLRPGENLGGKAVDAQGLLVPPADSPASPPAEFRVLCLGDSTCAVPYRSFPDIAQRLVETLPSARRIGVKNASVCGYTSEQALRWFGRLRKLRPQMVVVCLGWNDFFPALNLPDKELGARSFLHAAAAGVFGWSRLYRYLAAPKGESRLRRADALTSRPLRVTPEEFEANLRRLTLAVRAAGGTAVLATQPQNLTPESLAYFEREGYAASGEALAELHCRYNRIVRRVASEMRTPLLDFEEEFDRRIKAELFAPDGMHLSPPGHNLAARLLVGVLHQQEILSREEFEHVVHAARYDSTAPDKPHAAWMLEPAHVSAAPAQTLSVAALVQNTGNTRWLRRHVVKPYGSQREVRYGEVSIAGRWRTLGAPTTAPVARVALSHDLLPGESTSSTLTFPAPPTPGEYAMEIALEASGIGELKHQGAEVTTLTVSVQEAPQ